MLIGESSLSFNPLGKDSLAEIVPLCVIVFTGLPPSTPESITLVEIVLTGLEPAPAVLVPVDSALAITLEALVPQDEVVSLACAVISLSGLEPTEIPRFCPQHLFRGYAYDGANISIPIAKLPGLDVEEADAVTGDWREILQSLLLHSIEYHRNSQWSIQPRTYNVFLYNQFTTQTLNRRFKVDFFTNIGQPHVADEP